jgi:hypothetical protein
MILKRVLFPFRKSKSLLIGKKLKQPFNNWETLAEMPVFSQKKFSL